MKPKIIVAALLALFATLGMTTKAAAHGWHGGGWHGGWGHPYVRVVVPAPRVVVGGYYNDGYCAPATYYGGGYAYGGYPQYRGGYYAPHRDYDRGCYRGGYDRGYNRGGGYENHDREHYEPRGGRYGYHR